MKTFYSVTPPQPQLCYFNLDVMNGCAPPTALPTASLSAAGNAANTNYNNTAHAQQKITYYPPYQVVLYQGYQHIYVPAYTPCLLQCSPFMVINMNSALPFQRANSNLQLMLYTISNQQSVFLTSATFQAKQIPPERFTQRRHSGTYIGPIGRLKKTHSINQQKPVLNERTARL